MEDKKMNKKDIQKLVLYRGDIISIDDFSWDEENKIFSSGLDGLDINFSDIDGCTFDTGAYCTFITGSDCNFDTGDDCNFDTGLNCTFYLSPKRI